MSSAAVKRRSRARSPTPCSPRGLRRWPSRTHRPRALEGCDAGGSRVRSVASQRCGALGPAEAHRDESADHPRVPSLVEPAVRYQAVPLAHARVAEPLDARRATRAEPPARPRRRVCRWATITCRLGSTASSRMRSSPCASATACRTGAQRPDRRLPGQLPLARRAPDRRDGRLHLPPRPSGGPGSRGTSSRCSRGPPHKIDAWPRRTRTARARRSS